MSAWKTQKLNDVCRIKPPKKQARQSLGDDDLVSFVPMSDLGIRKKDIHPSCDKPLREVAGSYTYFADGDVLLAKITPCFENGKLGIANQMTNGIGFGSSEFIVFRPRGLLDAHYLFYFLSQDSFRNAGARVMSGAVGHKRVPKEFIENYQIPLPDIRDQRRIVAILDEAFAGIETAIANTEKNLANARELFESYLIKILGTRESGWQDLTLKEVCLDYGRGKSKHRPRNDPILYDGEYPFIQTGDVRRSDHLITTFSATYNEKGLAQSKLWPKGTICITIAANIAETGVLDFDACFPDSIIGLVVDPRRASNAYVEFLLQSVKTVLKAKGKGSAQDNINLGTLEKERFPFPPVQIQHEIVADVEDLRVSVIGLEWVYQKKLTALAELKQSLLHKAFSGELTADKLEDAVAEVVA